MEKVDRLLHPAGESRTAHLENFRHWAVAFVVCNFNVDIGPEIELVYPPETVFSTSDLTAICFNSFPERSDSDNPEDLAFHFVIRNNSPDISLRSPCAPHGSASNLYGHSVFRQSYDSSMKRSFDQRSLVLVSNHCFTSFFLRMLHRMTTSGIICDPTALEAACSEISGWPPPSVGRLNLPFMGSLLALEMSGLLPNPDLDSITYAYEPVGSWSNLARLMPSLTDLYHVVEKLLVCESVIVLGRSPQVCSDFISAVVDLIRPVPYAGEYRPYMTMQSEFSFVVTSNRAPRHFLLGVTNPFLVSRIFGQAESAGYVTPYVVQLNAASEPVAIKRHRSHSRRHRSLDLPGGVTADDSSKRYLKADHSFLKTLEASLQGDHDALDTVGPYVRRHFAELIGQFLAPLNRYLASSMSPTGSSGAGAGAARYSNFSTADFLKSLAKHGSAVKFKGQNALQRHKARDAFYGGFCQSPSFYSWLDMKLSLEREASAGLLSSTSPRGP